MKRPLALALLLTFVLSAAVASPASARYYLNRSEAISFARDWVHYKLGYRGSRAYCRPQYRDDVEPGYIYHAWLCAWRGLSANRYPMCAGLVIIKGSRESGRYYTRRIYSRGDCPY